MSDCIIITFPRELTNTNISTNRASIIGSSYMTFSTEEDTVVMLYKAIGVQLNFSSVGTVNTLKSQMTNDMPIHTIRTKLINNSIKIYMSGLILTTDNSVCLDKLITLEIPNTSDPDITQQYRFPFDDAQGCFIINYVYDTNIFTIVAMYFTFTKNPYIDIREGTASTIIL